MEIRLGYQEIKSVVGIIKRIVNGKPPKKISWDDTISDERKKKRRGKSV